MQCPSCHAKITSKHYDEEYEIFECPQCGAAYEPDELQEAENGSHPRVQAKGKKRRAAIADDAEALARFEEESLKPRAASHAEHKHRDEVSTKDVLEIFADEIEAIWAEFGTRIDRLNAREYFAMNIYRPLTFNAGVHFREKEVPRVYCDEHDS